MVYLVFGSWWVMDDTHCPVSTFFSRLQHWSYNSSHFQWTGFGSRIDKGKSNNSWKWQKKLATIDNSVLGQMLNSLAFNFRWDVFFHHVLQTIWLEDTHKINNLPEIFAVSDFPPFFSPIFSLHALDSAKLLDRGKNPVPVLHLRTEEACDKYTEGWKV